MTAVTDFTYCDELVAAFEAVVAKPKRDAKPPFYVGVDLGTACVVLAVLDEARRPVAGAYQYADVVRDGMVVDYIGAVRIVKTMKEQLEEALGEELVYAAAAIPPGTDLLDSGAIRNVVQSAGFTLTNLLDEPTAANEVLGLRDGAVVDIGGGTTGISILKAGEVVHVVDEPTGGTHFSLVISGAYKLPFDEAELYKRDPAHHKELLPVLGATIEKVSSIITQSIAGYKVDDVVLVGGTACLTGIEDLIEKGIQIPTKKPANPMFVTPLGIALSCGDAEMEF